jgi:starch synthase
MADTGSPSFAFFAQSDAYSTAGSIMGRQAAGVGFMRGLGRTWPTGTLHAVISPPFDREDMLATLGDGGFAGGVRWSSAPDFAGARTLGTLYYPGPLNPGLARFRNQIAPAAFSLMGVTHTLSTDRTLDGLSLLVMPPYKPWDAMICTSRAALAVISDLFDEVREELRRQAGVERFNRLQTPIIPLGVHCDQLEPSADRKAAGRKALGLADDEVAVLFAGRLSFHAKANPALLYQALQAVSGDAKLVCIEAGLHTNDFIRNAFGKAQRALAPDVRFIHVPGDDAVAYRAAWQAADIFTSLSDNIQETFGLTPVEAMAAGLPVIATDWNGYRDNVRHGLDGFLAPTLAPPPGAGADLGMAVEAGLLTYDRQIGLASLGVAINFRAVVDALRALATDPDLRRRMGESGRQHALATFDWPVVLRRYDELAHQLALIRMIGEAEPAEPWVQRADLFRRFASFATRSIGENDLVTLNPGAGPLLSTLQTLSIASFAFDNRFAARELPGLIADILAKADGPTPVRVLLAAVGGDIPVNQRALAWLAKFNVVTVTAA